MLWDAFALGDRAAPEGEAGGVGGTGRVAPADADGLARGVGTEGGGESLSGRDGGAVQCGDRVARGESGGRGGPPSMTPAMVAPPSEPEDEPAESVEASSTPRNAG